MNGLPDPLTPPDSDLRGLDFMPLFITRLRKSKAWLMAKRQPELGFYMINLWTAAWHEVPAASLEIDDDVLADNAMCDPDTWLLIRDKVLRGWVKCSDGRLYHPVVAERANDAWATRKGFRERLAAVRGKRGKKQATENTTSQTTEQNTQQSAGQTTEQNTERSTGQSTGQTTEQSTGQSTGVKERVESREGRGERGEERKEDSASLRSAAADAALADERDDKTRLWQDGLSILKALTKRGDGPARKLLGRMVDAIGADHVALLAILCRAEIQQPDEPIPWIRAAIEDNGSGSLPLALVGDDPWGIRAWTARQAGVVLEVNNETKQREPAINGHLIGPTMEAVANAAGLPETWRGNWDALADWMRDDIWITDEVIYAIRHQAERMGGDFRSIAVFDSTVRRVGKRVAC